MPEGVGYPNGTKKKGDQKKIKSSSKRSRKGEGKGKST